MISKKFNIITLICLFSCSTSQSINNRDHKNAETRKAITLDIARQLKIGRSTYSSVEDILGPPDMTIPFPDSPFEVV